MRLQVNDNGNLQQKDQVPSSSPRLVMLALGTIALFAICCYLTVPFLPALAWALALAIIAYPLHQWLATKISYPDVTAGISVALVTLFIVVPAALLFRHLTVEARNAGEAMRENSTPTAILAAADEVPYLREAVVWVEEHFDAEEIRRLVVSKAGNVSGFVEGSIWVALQIMTMVFVLFYFFRDGRRFMSGLHDLAPLSGQELERLSTRVQDSIYATVYGTFLTGMIQGVTGGLLFWWLGLPGPVLWGTVMFVLGILPLVGGILVWAPAAVYLLVEGRFGAAAILVTWGVLMAGPISSWIYARAAGGRMRMHPVPTLIAYLGGLAVFGASGMVLGPVILALTLGLIDIWRGRMLPERAGLQEG